MAIDKMTAGKVTQVKTNIMSKMNVNKMTRQLDRMPVNEITVDKTIINQMIL